VVGNNVPFLASTGTNATNLNNTFNQVDRQDVGITLRITPQISSRDYVTLKVYTEVSSLVLATLNSALGPTTNKRQSDTTIIAKDGQMIVTGGLISDDVSENDEGVPYLKDIPVIGHAFKSNSRARAQKNLLIFLTPRIIKDQFDARDSTIESRDRMDDVIAHYNVQPKRSPTLHNDRMNQVAESNPYEGPKPGTILPPSKAFKNDQAPKSTSKKGDDSVVLDGSSDGVLDLDAAKPTGPVENLDTDPIVNLDSLPSPAEAKASLRAPQANTLQRPLGAFVVLEKTSKGSAAGLPIAGNSTNATLGVIIPTGSSPAAQQFFRAGARYVYTGRGEKVELRARRVFSSPTEAESAFPEVSGSWYTLPTSDVASLGHGPWYSKASR
jgi:hypothetical protein